MCKVFSVGICFLMLMNLCYAQQAPVQKKPSFDPDEWLKKNEHFESKPIKREVLGLRLGMSFDEFRKKFGEIPTEVKKDGIDREVLLKNPTTSIERIRTFFFKDLLATIIIEYTKEFSREIDWLTFTGFIIEEYGEPAEKTANTIWHWQDEKTLLDALGATGEVQYVIVLKDLNLKLEREKETKKLMKKEMTIFE